jgi:hypothetical protein
MLQSLSTRIPEAERPYSTLVFVDSVGKAPIRTERPGRAGKPTSDTSLLAEIGSVGQTNNTRTDQSSLHPCPVPIATDLGSASLALIAVSALVAALFPFVSVFAATSITLGVGARGTLPGVHSADIPRYLVQHMREVRLAGWRFELASGRRKTAPSRRMEL